MRYKDEKYVERLEKELKELRRKYDRTIEAVQDRALAKGGDIRGSSAVQAEETYRRARTEVAAEAGAGYGRVSLEALYLLPAEFTNAYQRLFLAALKESPGRTGEANPPLKPAPKLIRESPDDVLDRDPDRGGGRARANGRRHRDHWIVKDERLLRLKTGIDRELRALASEITESLSKPRAAGMASPTVLDEENSGDRATQCTKCSRFLKSNWRHCPNCGTITELGAQASRNQKG